MNLSSFWNSYDFRAIYPTEIDESAYYLLGRAYARHFGFSRVAIGHDSRVSSVSLAQAFSDGVRAEGASVVALGMVATDMLHHATVLYPDVDFGVMVTASHNPKEYNGLKSCRKHAVPINLKKHAQAIRALVDGGIGDAPEAVPTGSFEARDILSEWIDHVASFVDASVLRSSRIVADAGNGVAGTFMPALAEKLDLSLDPLYFEPDGNFPNHQPSPIEPKNMVDLIARVLATGADLGVAFDGDADRMYACDETGRIFSGTQMTAIIASIMLERFPGATIPYNTVTGNDARDRIASLGGVGIELYVWHVYFKELMAERPDIPFAGEHSGHYYFRDNAWVDSGVIAFVIFLEYLSKRGIKASELWDEFHRYEAIPEENFRVRDIGESLDAIAARYADTGAVLTRGDGLSVRYADWWFNVRPSSNEPLLRLNIEAPTVGMLAEKRAELSEFIRTNCQA